MEEPTEKEIEKIWNEISEWHVGLRSWKTAEFLAKLQKRIEELEKR